MPILCLIMNINVRHSDLASAQEAKDLIDMLDHYAKDIMGGGKPLSDYVKTHLVDALRQRHDSVVVLAYDGSEPVGLAIAFEGFSTFAAKPLLNLHDIVVRDTYRGKGIATLLLRKIEDLAQERGCCKLTLEVLQGNHQARKVYESFGFNNYQLDAQMGHAVFLQKSIKENL